MARNKQIPVRSGTGKGKIAEKKPKKPRRFHPGTVALREIRKHQKGTELLMRRAPFRRLVREVTQDFRTDARFTENSLSALQEAAESYLIEVFSQTQRLAIHAGRITVGADDMRLGLRMRKLAMAGEESMIDAETRIKMRAVETAKQQAKAERKEAKKALKAAAGLVAEPAEVAV
jgi:histone H3